MRYGIKTNPFNIEDPESLHSEPRLEYIQYPAPTLSKNYLDKCISDTGLTLVPHSAFISLCSPRKPSEGLLTALKDGLLESSANYLGEHMGYMNPNPNGPTLGYVMMPPMNKQTCELIARNVAYMQSFLGLPLALENPNIYYAADGSDMTYGEFITHLSELLPESTGWLIDISHLIVSSRNLNTPTSDILKAYANTKRQIFEMHIAGTKIDKQGVSHDDHSELIDSEVINTVINYFEVHSMRCENITFELDDANTTSLAQISSTIDGIESRDKHPKAPLESTLNLLTETIPSPNTVDAIVADKYGRLKILKSYLLAQIKAPDGIDFELLSSECNLDDSMNDFMDWLTKDNDIQSIGLFDCNQYEGISLVRPFRQWLIEKCGNNLSGESLRLYSWATYLEGALLSQLPHYKNLYKEIYLNVETSESPYFNRGFYKIINKNNQTSVLEVPSIGEGSSNLILTI